MPNNNLVLTNCLAGSLLLSVPGRFSVTHPLEECVVYIYEHIPELGAQGVVINRQSELTVKMLLEKMGYNTDSLLLDDPLYHGGRKDESAIMMVHSAEWYSSNTRAVTADISVSSDTFMIDKLIEGNGPREWLMCAGKCSWEPGHLELEVVNKQWLTLPATRNLVFANESGERQWRKTLEACSKQTVNSWF